VFHCFSSLVAAGVPVLGGHRVDNEFVSAPINGANLDFDAAIIDTDIPVPAFSPVHGDCVWRGCHNDEPRGLSGDVMLVSFG